MKKEVSPKPESPPCDVCARTILKGERTEHYLGPGGQRYTVCDLCRDRAEQSGWIREAAHHDLPTRTARSEPRRSLLGRLRRRDDEDAEEGPVAEEGRAADSLAADEREQRRPAVASGAVSERDGDEAESRVPRHDARHVRAVPTNAEVKIERALEIFNTSEHARTVSGLVRSLGAPDVSVQPAADPPSEVIILVAWELSWYRFRVDLGDELEQVLLQEKGEELAQLEPELPEWNASVDQDGYLVVGVGSEQ